MKNTRYYNLDAYRSIKDLRDKVNSKFSYNNCLLTCYDACILLLNDLYHSLPMAVQPKLEKVNVESLVECLSDRNYTLEQQFNDYDRLYHTYCLVYSGYIQARDIDVNVGIKCLRAILEYYIAEINFEKLIQMYDFVISEKHLEAHDKADTIENRNFIANVLNLYDIPNVEY